DGELPPLNEVGALRRGTDEPIDAAARNHGAKRVQPQPAVLAQRRQEAEAHAVLIDQLAPALGDLRCFRFQVCPAFHLHPPARSGSIVLERDSCCRVAEGLDYSNTMLSRWMTSSP